MTFAEAHKTDEIFENVLPDGERQFFNATQLRSYAMETKIGVEYIRATMDSAHAMHVSEHCGIEEPRLASITPERLAEPLLAVRLGDGSALLIDGHHRLVKRWRHGLKFYDVMVVKAGHWEWSLIVDLPEFVQDWMVSERARVQR